MQLYDIEFTSPLQTHTANKKSLFNLDINKEKTTTDLLAKTAEINKNNHQQTTLKNITPFLEKNIVKLQPIKPSPSTKNLG